MLTQQFTDDAFEAAKNVEDGAWLRRCRVVVNTPVQVAGVWTSKRFTQGNALKINRPLLVAWFALQLAACATTPAPSASATVQGDAAHPAQTQGWVDTKLYFGLGPADQPGQGVSESSWRAFLDKEVTPRFPEGLSVFDVSGQWLSPKRGTIGYEHSKALLILYQDSPRHRADIEAIRSAWKTLTNDESVLRINQNVDVSF